MAKLQIPTTKSALLKAIKDLCKEDKCDFNRKVGIGQYWTGKRMATSYACAISKNHYYIHSAAMCQGYDMGEDIPYLLKELDYSHLVKLYKRLNEEYEPD